MFVDIIKAFCVGICTSIPLGPLAIFVIYRSLCSGHLAGFLTGLGATLVDITYATLAIFAFAVVEKFVHQNEMIIFLVGGLIVLGMGAGMTFKDPFKNMDRNTGENKKNRFTLKDFLKAVAIGFSNPGAFLLIFTFLALFNINLERNQFAVMPLILAVAAGSVTYWFFYSMLFAYIRKTIKLRMLMWINRGCGIIVMLIGLSLFADGLMKLLFK